MDGYVCIMFIKNVFYVLDILFLRFLFLLCMVFYLLVINIMFFGLKYGMLIFNFWDFKFFNIFRICK